MTVSRFGGIALILATSGTAVAQQSSPLTAPTKNVREVDASDRYVFGIRWHLPVVRTGLHRSVGTSFGSPAVSTRHNLVIVGQGEGEVRAFDLDSSELRWRYRYGVPFETTATIISIGRAGDALRNPSSEELALLTSRDGQLIALSARTGELRWQTDLEADCRAPLVDVTHAGQRFLIATTVANRVVVIDPANGKVRWSEGRPPPTRLTVEGHAGAAFSSKRGWVVTTFADGYVEAYRIADGSRVWSRPLSFADSDFSDADADPVIVGDRLFVASYSDGLFALSLEDGQTIWSQSAQSITAMALHDEMLLAASADGLFWGLSQKDGAMIYRTHLPPGPASRIQVREGLAVLSSGSSGLLVLDARSGQPLQATAFGGRVAGAPAWTGKQMALLTSGGRLYALSQGDAGLIR